MRDLRHGYSLATIFGRPFLIRLLSQGAEELREILSLSGINPSRPLTVAGAYEAAYSFLCREYRCEYVYKNAVAAKIVLGRHSPNTTTLLSELMVQDSQVDLVLANGDLEAFEIKTELDSLRRLSGQMNDYRKVFKKCTIICFEDSLDEVLAETDGHVGVLTMTRRYTLSTVRPSRDSRSGLDKSAMFEVLRKAEYEAIIRECFGATPDVPNTRIFTECKSLFLRLPVDVAHAAMAAALKSRRRHKLGSSQLRRLPHSLKLHGLSGTLDPGSLSKLHEPTFAFN